MTRDEVAEWLPILAAFAVGQQIQFRRGQVVVDWRDVDEQIPTLRPGMEFRIKPVVCIAELEGREITEEMIDRAEAELERDKFECGLYTSDRELAEGILRAALREETN